MLQWDVLGARLGKFLPMTALGDGEEGRGKREMGEGTSVRGEVDGVKLEPNQRAIVGLN